MLRIEEKDAKRRKKRISSILRDLPSLRSLGTLGNPRKLPQIQLYGASQQFILGFHENSILLSAFAAEYGVLLRLNQELEQKEKDEIASKGGLSFSTAIKMSKERLIDDELANKLDILNNLRNMAAHPSNWVTLIKQLDQNQFLNPEAMKKWILKVTDGDATRIVKDLKELLEPDKVEKALERLVAYKEKRLGKMPELEWAAHQRTLRRQTLIVKEYSRQMIREMLLNREIIKLIDQTGDAAKYIQRKYRYPEEISLKAITIAYETLKQLGFLD